MLNKKSITIFGVFFACMFAFITFAGGTPQNQAIATRDVTFIDSYNNEELKSQRVIVGEDAEVPENPEHDELLFLGWYLNEDRTTKVTDFTNITENITVVAIYGEDRNRNGIADDTEPKYTVTFIDSYNGNVLSRQTVLTGLNAAAPTVESHDNLEFVGWTTSFTNITRDLTIYTVYTNAQMSAQERLYYVTFIDSVTNEIIEESRVLEGLTVSAPDALEHKGYLFVKWDGELSNITSDRTIYAVYASDINGNKIDDETEDRYVITFTEGEHGKISGQTVYENLLIDQTLESIIEPTVEADENYTFDKFVNADNEEFSTDGKVTGNMTFTAIYTPDKDENNNGIHDEEEYFQVSVNVIGGIADEETKSVQYGNSETFIITPDEDYTLHLVEVTGDCTVDELTGVLTIENVKEDKSCTVTLQEDKNPKDGIADKIQFNVKYDKNLENVIGNEPVDTNYYILNDTVTILENSELDGLTLENAKFIGWSKTKLELLVTEEDYLNNKENILTAGNTIEFTETENDLTLYAVFASTHTVKYNYCKLDDNGQVIEETVENKVLDGTILDTKFVSPSDYNTNTNKYVFNNWVNTATNEEATDTEVVKSDLNLKAEYKKYATIKFVGANGNWQKDILAGDNAVLEDNSILTLANHTFNGWDKSLENIEENTVFNAKYIANIIGLDVSLNNTVFNIGLTEETLKNSLTVTPNYAQTNYNPSLITKETLNYTINGFNNSVGVHSGSVNFKNISKPFTYTVVDNTISNQIATSTGTFREAGRTYDITDDFRWNTDSSTGGRVFCINSARPCNGPAEVTGYRYSTTLETLNFNFIELYFSSLEESIPENMASTGTVYYTDGTSNTVSIRKMNYSVYVGGYGITPTFKDVRLIVSGLNNTNILNSGKSIAFIELPYKENGVNHKAIYKNNNGTFTVVK